MKLLVTIWIESNIAFFTKIQSGFLTWGASPLLFLAYPVIDCIISNFITDFRQLSCRRGRYLLLLIFEDICNMHQQSFAEIPVNPTCVLPQSASIDGTADMHCLLIDPNKNGKLATTISCYDDLSCKSWCFDRGDQLFLYLYYIGKYFEASQSQPCHFEFWHNDELSWGAFFQQM